MTKEVEEYEKLFDDKLRFYEGGEMQISLESPLTHLAEKKLRRMYTKAGWKIKFSSEPREGNWVEFS